MPLRGKKLLITSGPTRTPLDAVRYITNKATGRLGALIAEEVIRRGALVTFVYGRGSQTPVLRGPRLNDLQEIEGGRHTGYFVTPDGKVKESAVGKEAIARALAEYLEEHLDS